MRPQNRTEDVEQGVRTGVCMKRREGEGREKGGGRMGDP